MNSPRDSLFGMPLHGEACCCELYDVSHAGFCTRCQATPAADRSFDNGLESSYGVDYDPDYAENFSGMLSPSYPSMLDLQDQFEDDFGSYASIACNLSHVESQLEFEDFETYGSVGGLSCEEEVQDVQDELQETEVLDSIACMGCGGIGCMCFQANCSDITGGSDANNPWARRGPLARLRLGRWFRRKTMEVDEKQRVLEGGEGLKQRRGMRLGLARFNPWRRHPSELSTSDQKLAAQYGWGMGLGRLRLTRARRVRVVQERPMKRQFFLILLVVAVLFCALFWRQLGLRRIVLQALRMEAHQHLCRGSNLSAGPWRYCGPHNGHDFSRTPMDTMDAICAQHDFCIEMSEYLIEGRPRMLYPMGTQDEDEFLRCGIPMRSHTDPNFGCQINACDAEMFNSLHKSFECSADPSMPKSPWCQDQRFVGQEACSEYGLTLQYVACKAVARMSKAYHAWKIRNTCSFISRHLQSVLETLEEDDDDHDAAGGARAEEEAATRGPLHAKPRRRRPWSLLRRLAGSLWATLRRRREASHVEPALADSGPSAAPWLARPGGWNCTCQLPEQVHFRPPANVERALRMREAP